MVGRTLGHYRVLEKLGEGGMGEVYLAEDTKLERKVALKVLPSEMADSPERLERFEREAKAVAALNHPNIVHIYSVEEVDGLHFFTMEVVEGGGLGELIPPEGLPLDQFFDLAVPLADALSEAHDQGIVHRDLKPSNVMVDGKGRPKILDFGLAKLRRPERAAEFSELPTEVMTEEGKVLGTYPYMSPEQVEGKAVDHRSDIFSFGTMLYEMATGHRPFSGDSPASLMSAILRDSPSAVDAERQELPHHLARIIGRCLEKQAEDRYQRARDLARDLEDLRQEVQTGSRKARRPSTVAAPERGRWMLIGAAALVVLLVAAILYWNRPWDRAAPAPPEPRITSLAVLPLANLSGDPEQDYYAAGITEGLIADLGRVGALRVISRQSVMRYRDSDLSVPDIAGELGVEALIEGSVLPAGDRVRVTAQLIQADPERQLWSQTYEREAKNILALLGEVTRQIVAEVEVALTDEEQARLAESRQVEPEALRAYLKGAYLYGMLTPEEVEKSANYFLEAVEIDPMFAEAWAGLAGYYQALELWILPITANDLRRKVAVEGNKALAQALELDDSNSLVHTFKALYEFWREWDWLAAEASFRKAIELNPSSSPAHSMFGLFLAAMGRCNEARSEARIAERLDPGSQIVLRARGDVLYYCHDFQEALEQYDKTLELFPGNAYALTFKGMTLISLGRTREAVEIWQRLRSWEGNDEMAEQFEGKSLEEVNRIYLEAATDPSHAYYNPFVNARVYAENREADRVFEWLERALAAGTEPGGYAGHLITFLKVDPDFLFLHGDARFEDILERMDLAD